MTLAETASYLLKILQHHHHHHCHQLPYLHHHQESDISQWAVCFEEGGKGRLWPVQPACGQSKHCLGGTQATSNILAHK